MIQGRQSMKIYFEFSTHIRFADLCNHMTATV